jgi:ribosome-associated translation inhibitor RaiA
MILPVKITFRNMSPSDAVAARVQEEAEKLDEFYKRITSCRVIVEVPHRHHALGDQVHVRIKLGVPGGEIVVRHEPSLHSALKRGAEEGWEKHLEANPQHKYIGVVIRDAFKAARRRLQDYARRQRGQVKVHDATSRLRKDKCLS